MKPVLSILRICLLLTCSVLLAGVIYQFTISKYEDHKFIAPGKLVDIGGYSLHLNCRGEGSPAVILEAGMGSNSLDWSLVQPEAAKFTRVNERRLKIGLPTLQETWVEQELYVNLIAYTSRIQNEYGRRNVL